jgi:hypothetical protein
MTQVENVFGDTLTRVRQVMDDAQAKSEQLDESIREMHHSTGLLNVHAKETEARNLQVSQHNFVQQISFLLSKYYSFIFVGKSKYILIGNR